MAFPHNPNPKISDPKPPLSPLSHDPGDLNVLSDDVVMML